MNNEVANEWLNEALRQPLGHKIYIPCIDKETQKRDCKDLRIALAQMGLRDPASAATLQIGKIPRKGHLWVVITRVHADPLVGFLETPDGKTERIQIAVFREVHRRAAIMQEDGMSPDEILLMFASELSDQQLQELQKWLTTE